MNGFVAAVGGEDLGGGNASCCTDGGDEVVGAGIGVEVHLGGSGLDRDDGAG